MYDNLIKELHEGAEFLECSTPGIKNSFAKMCHNAADTIEELQQTVEHYKGCSDDWYKEACDYKAKLPRWIPVTERLPEKHTFNLVYSNETGVDILYFGYRGLFLDRYSDEVKGITHWMPLPEPPKEGD